MIKVITYCSLICCFFGCTYQTNNNASKTIVAKWNYRQSDANNCEDDGYNSPTSGIFYYKGKRYVRGESYVLDSRGKIDSVYSYAVPLGVNIYSIETYGRYMMSLDTIGFNKMKMIQIKWNEETHKIIDDNKVITPTFIEEDHIILNHKSSLTIYDLK